MESTPEDVILSQRQGDETSSAEPLVGDERVAYENADEEMTNGVNENFATLQLSESYQDEVEAQKL